tara:strand:+ start:4041 stop:4664 length:624 start_codon:yes stop_codon:yes gene_type:complete
LDSLGDLMQKTLMMLHGLTGSAELMEPFANKICPTNFNLIVPNGTFKHDTKGYCWWHYEINKDEKSKHDLEITETLLKEIHSSINYLSALLPKSGDVIIGGFSQGGVMAQIMMLSELSSRISGLLLLGTRAMDNEKLRHAIKNLNPVPILWMHGYSDEIIKYEDSMNIVKIFEDEGWNVTKISHKKGHMIPLEFHQQIIDFINNNLN